MPVETPENKKLHPNAEYRGKSVHIEKAIEGGITLKLDLRFDDRDPSQWGTHPIDLWIEPIIHRSQIENVNQLRRIAFVLEGPLAILLREALNELKLGLGSLRPGTLSSAFSDHENEVL